MVAGTADALSLAAPKSALATCVWYDNAKTSNEVVGPSEPDVDRAALGVERGMPSSTGSHSLVIAEVQEAKATEIVHNAPEARLTSMMTKLEGHAVTEAEGHAAPELEQEHAAERARAQTSSEHNDNAAYRCTAFPQSISCS